MGEGDNLLIIGVEDKTQADTQGHPKMALLRHLV